MRLVGLALFCSLVLAPHYAEAKGFDQSCWFQGGANGLDNMIKGCTGEIQSSTGDNQAQAYSHRALAWFRKGEYQKALADSDEAIRLATEVNVRNEAMKHRAMALQGLRKYDQAIEIYSTIIEKFPEWAEGYVLRGSAYGAMGKLGKSIADSTRAIRLMKKNFIPRGGTDAKKDPDFNPDMARALYNRGLAWNLKGNYMQALADYRQALRSNPADPNNWATRPGSWESRSEAEQARILYRGKTFSADMMTSDVRIVDIWDVNRTRYGDVILVQTDLMPAATVMLNGKVVFKDDGMYVALYGTYSSGDDDVVLVGSNPGGSATPDTQMSFLIVKPDGKVRVITHPRFVADSPGTDGVKVTVDDSGRIFASFAYIEGKEMVAELGGGKMAVHANHVNGPMDSDNCQALYEIGTEVCSPMPDGTHIPACENESVAHAGEKGISSGTGPMLAFRYYSNRPGFIKSGFSKSCYAWCKGKAVSYQKFSKITCGL